MLLAITASTPLITTTQSAENATTSDTEHAQLAQAARQTTGSAFLVGSDGLLVTNVHVVKGCDNTRFVLADWVEPVKVVFVDPDVDIAILASQTPARRAGLALRSNPKLKEPVTIFGYPLAGNAAKNGRVAVGVVLEFSSDARVLATNASVLPGNSGSPVLDQSGAVVGVVFGINNKRTFAIPVDAIKAAFAKAKLSPSATRGGDALPVARVIDKARASTGKIECWR